MRFGTYARVDGRTFRTVLAFTSPVITVLTGEDPPVPSDWAWRPDANGGWRADVPRERAERLFEVVTWALYDEVFPVHLLDRQGDASVLVEFMTGPERPRAYESVATPRDGEGRPVAPSGFRPMDRPGSPLVAVVPIAALTDVVESEKDLPLSADDARRQWGR